MLDLAPAYARDLATQIGFLSAFLGGFAATLFGVLLTASKENKAVGASIGLAALSGVGFMIAVTASTTVVFAAHPDAPAIIAEKGFVRPQIMMSLAFALGVYSLLACIGFAGWARSPGTGMITSIVALVGAAVVTLALSV